MFLISVDHYKAHHNQKFDFYLLLFKKAAQTINQIIGRSINIIVWTLQKKNFFHGISVLSFSFKLFQVRSFTLKSKCQLCCHRLFRDSLHSVFTHKFVLAKVLFFCWDITYFLLATAQFFSSGAEVPFRFVFFFCSSSLTPISW